MRLDYVLVIWTRYIGSIVNTVGKAYVTFTLTSCNFFHIHKVHDIVLVACTCPMIQEQATNYSRIPSCSSSHAGKSTGI